MITGNLPCVPCKCRRYLSTQCPLTFIKQFPITSYVSESLCVGSTIVSFARDLSFLAEMNLERWSVKQKLGGLTEKCLVSGQMQCLTVCSSLRTSKSNQGAQPCVNTRVWSRHLARLPLLCQTNIPPYRPLCLPPASLNSNSELASLNKECHCFEGAIKIHSHHARQDSNCLPCRHTLLILD